MSTKTIKQAGSEVEGLAAPSEGGRARADSSRARWWRATVSAKKMSREDIESALEGYSVLGQLEKGEQGGEDGYLHWQLVLRSPTPVRFSTLKKRLPTAWLGVADHPARAVAYVCKSQTRVPGVEPIQIGEDLSQMGQGKRTDLDEIRTEIFEKSAGFDEIILRFPTAARNERAIRTWIQVRDRQMYGKHERDLRVRVIYGKSGSGKSRHVADTYGYEQTYKVSDYRHGFDSYDSHGVLVFEEFVGQLPSAQMLQILDRYPGELPARYSNKIMAFNEVVIVSNVPPAEWYQVEGLPSLGGPDKRKSILPEHVPALARRIHSVEEMIDGQLVDRTEDALQALRDSVKY